MPQRPVKRACERNDKAVAKWTKEGYPAIVKKAADEDAESAGEMIANSEVTTVGGAGSP